MEIKSQNQDGVEIVSPRGAIDIHAVSTLKRYFARRYEGRGVKIVLDLSQVEFVSTNAIGGIMAIKQRVEEKTTTGKEGQLVLSDLNAEIVRSSFASDEFAGHFTTFPTRADAIVHLLSQP